MSNARNGVALSILFFGVVGAAAADDSRSMQDRLDRVERDLNQLQRQVYRSEVGGGPAPTAPSAEGGGSGPQALDSQIRMDQIETQMRAITGQQEEIQYSISQLSSRLEKMQSDNEVRFQQLENTPPAAASAKVAAVAPGKKPAAAAPGAAHGAGNMDQPASASGMLSAPDSVAAAPAAAPPAEPAAGGDLPSGTSQVQYNYAFGILRSGDYDGAEAAFKVFLQKHPADPLAANAQYWLGETYFVRKNYTAAASTFAEAYQKSPQGPKAPDDLLKMGMSLGNVGRKQDACFSFARLERDFPNLAPALKDRMTSEKKRYGC